VLQEKFISNRIFTEDANMNAKKVLAQVGTIVSIVAASIFAFIYLIALPAVEESVRLIYEGQMFSEEQMRLLITYTTIMMVVMAVSAVVVLTISIVTEVKLTKKKNHKGWLIALLVLDAIYGVVLVIMGQILGLLLFLAAAIVLLVSLCLKEEAQKPATELEQKHDNENVLF